VSEVTLDDACGVPRGIPRGRGHPVGTPVGMRGSVVPTGSPILLKVKKFDFGVHTAPENFF